MVKSAVEVAPAEYALSSFWEGTPTIVGEAAGPANREARALAENDDATVIAQDDFTAADSTAINGRTLSPTDPGSNWVADTSFTIQSNAAECDATTTETAEVDVGAADVRVEVDVTWGFRFGSDGTEWNGVLLRGDGAGKFLVFQPVGWDGTRVFKLFDETGAVVAGFHPSPATATSGVSSAVEIDCSGTRIKCTVDGSVVGSYDLSAAEAVDYETSTGFGLYSNEVNATPVGNWDGFTVTGLDSIDVSYLEATSAGVVRYFHFRPPTLGDDEVFELVSVLTRQSRTGAGLWSVRFGALNDDGQIVWAEAPAAPVSIPQTGVFSDRYSGQVTATLDGRFFDQFEPTGLFVNVRSVTEDDTAAFGSAKLSSALLRLRYNAAPTISIDTVNVTGVNPLVEWTYADAESDPQDSYDVRVFLPATISADPTAPLETLDAVYQSGRVRSRASRSHRVDTALEPATLYTFAVRVYQESGRDRVSTWDTFDATTPDGLDTVTTVNAVAGVGEATVTVSTLGAATRADIYRNGDLVAADARVTTEATTDSIDTFTRADGPIGNEEGPNTRAWTVDTGTGGSTTVIDTNQALITGNGGATVPVGTAEIAVSALVDVTLSPAGVRARGGATGAVDAIVGPDLVELRTFDSGGSAHGANTLSVAHDIPGDQINVKLVTSGDDYLVFLNGELFIRNNDPTVPSKAETGAGISSGGYTGVHRVDSFEAKLLDAEIEFVDNPPQGVTLDYDAIVTLQGAGSVVHAAALASASQITVSEGTWRLRSLISSLSYAFEPEDLAVSQGRSGETTPLLDGTVNVAYSQPKPRRFRMAIRTLNQADHDTLETLLSLSGDLGLTDVYGNSYTVRHASDIGWSHVVSEPEPGEGFSVRHHWIARVALQEV